MHNDPTYAGVALRAGALGYVLKRCAAAELLSAVHEVVRGRTYVTPLAVKGTAGRGIPAEKSFGNLTGREREVLQLAAAGHSVKKIAASLQISVKTVAFHKSNIMRKLDIHTTAELCKYAVQHGIAERWLP